MVFRNNCRLSNLQGQSDHVNTHVVCVSSMSESSDYLLAMVGGCPEQHWCGLVDAAHTF